MKHYVTLCKIVQDIFYLDKNLLHVGCLLNVDATGIA